MQNKNEIKFGQNNIKKDELVALINYLNGIIKSYYNTTRQIIFDSRKSTKISNIYINYFEKSLYDFIQKAKEIFNKMKNVQKKNLIQQEIEKSQSYNFCNNNFFYYSNSLTTENENYYNYTQNLNRLMKNNEYRKISNNSPNTNSNFNLNYINYTNNNYHPFNDKSQTPRSLQSSLKNLIIEKSNNNLNNNHANFKSKQHEIILKSNKEELLKKLLVLLKNLKRMNGKIFYDTNEARIYKKLIYAILGDVGKLVEILSKEQNENQKKCLSEKQYNKSEKFMGIFRNNKPLNSLDRNNNSLSPIIINDKTFNDINRNNIVNDFKNKMKISKSQKLKSTDICKIMGDNSNILSLKNKNQNQNRLNNTNINKNKSQSQPTKENIINEYSKKSSIRNLLFKDSKIKMKSIKQKIIENKSSEKMEKSIKLIDKEQQTENLFNNNKIIEEKSLFIECDNSKIIQKEKIIKDLENKIQTLKNNLTLLKDDLSNSNNQLSFFKSDNEKQNKQISDMSKEITLMKKLIDNKDKIDLQNKEEISNKNKGNLTGSNYELQTDIDKMSIRYELLKIDYNKQKNDLKEKEQLINNYNMYINTNDSKNIDELVCQLAKKHKDEIDKLNKKYTRDIINLKINLPNCFSPETHQILIDKKYSNYNLHWYLLTVTSAEEKDYENTYWVSENEIKATLDQFNKFKTEEELEKEAIQDYLNSQQKLIKRIENNENYIIKLESQLKKNESNNK